MTTDTVYQPAEANKRDNQRTPEIVYGAKAIAEATDEPDVRKVHYRLERGLIPGARKIGRVWALSLPVFRRAMHGDTA